MTRYGLLPADDPASMESLRGLASRSLPPDAASSGRRRRPSTTDELLRLMRTMPPDLRLTVAEGEALTDRAYRYLRAHGWTDQEIRTACAEVMHPVRRPVLGADSVTAGGNLARLSLNPPRLIILG